MFFKANIDVPLQPGLRRDGYFAQQPEPRHDADLCSTDIKTKGDFFF